MEEILTVYARPVDPVRPLICFDEAGKELTSHTRPPRPLAPGHPVREDTEYARQGSANLFVCCAPHLGWRHITVTTQRTARDFAHAIRDLVDVHFPAAERIVLVLDNLNTHTPAALYQTFPPAEAWRILQKLEAEVAAWVAAHNQAHTPVDWRFTVQEAREKLAQVYPIPQQGSSA